MASTPSLGRLEELLERLRRRTRPPAVMGILNITPDSFSDGNRFLDPQPALDHALEMIDQGADLIDVGPESTRPGAEPVPASRQIERAIPVIRAIRQARPQVLVSIDTQDARVARQAIDAGADLVNDVSALRADPAMADLVATTGVGVVLMHMRGTPKTMQTADGGPVYENVVGEVGDFLRSRVASAVAAGIGRDRIIVDPGIGFGKTIRHNLELLHGLPELADPEIPLLVGASRKGFIGRVTGVETPSETLAGSLACAVWAARAGAAILRVHDVAATRQALAMTHAIAHRNGAETR
ncbi:MAG: dihydropteroate synthase [Planctomycetes bacterium]|nr:dihydropteroate synthase [Planctomycetota bacterium]